MKQVVEDNITMRRYLLGELSEVERGEVEERLFLDGKYFQDLRIAEDDLIDDYVYGELSPAERERFDNYFLSNPERHESLRIASALRKYSSNNPVLVPSASSLSDVPHTAPTKRAFPPFWQTPNPLLRLSMAAAILLIVLGGLWLIIRAIWRPALPEPVQVQLPQQPEKERNVRPDSQPGERRAGTQGDVAREPDQQTGQQNQERPIVAAEKERETEQGRRQREQARESAPSVRRRPAQVYSFLLLPVGPVREEGEVNRIDLPSDAGWAILQLPLIGDTDYRSYQAILSTPDRGAIRTWRGLKSTTAESGRIVSIRVPAELLRQQKYELKLSGITAGGIIQDISRFSFHVNKR